MTNTTTSAVHPWLHPISLALYSFEFRSGGEVRQLEDAVRSLTDGVHRDGIVESIRKITDELENPTQEVCRVLPGAQRSEQESRAFLRLVVSEIRTRLGP